MLEDFCGPQTWGPRKSGTHIRTEVLVPSPSHDPNARLSAPQAALRQAARDAARVDAVPHRARLAHRASASGTHGVLRLARSSGESAGCPFARRVTRRIDRTNVRLTRAKARLPENAQRLTPMVRLQLSATISSSFGVLAPELTRALSSRA